jgi:hypothetical protein
MSGRLDQLWAGASRCTRSLVVVVEPPAGHRWSDGRSDEWSRCDADVTANFAASAVQCRNAELLMVPTSWYAVCFACHMFSLAILLARSNIL